MSQSDRELPDWLSEFVENTKWGEAPLPVYFWVGAATVAAALRRQCWIDMGTFVWRPNLYTLLVAPPGIIAKSTTADMGFRILRKIPSIKFGPATITWQALYDAFAEVGEEFTTPDGENHFQFPLTIVSSEFGITLNTKDTEMIDQLVHIWDGYEMSKRTRKDGELRISDPCLNMIACTTPDWIAGNFPRYLIGGGLTSRMIFVYADAKARYIAYPQDHMPPDYKERQEKLLRDLERISLMTGPFTLTKDARDWGSDWYEDFHKTQAPKMDKHLIGGYIARKQTLVHKISMVLSASASPDRIITRTTIERAVGLLSQLEKDMPKVFSQIGMTAEAAAGDRIVELLKRYGGKMPFTLLYRTMHKDFPDPNKFDQVLVGLQDAGYIGLSRATGEIYITGDS